VTAALRERVAEFLRAHHVMTLATQGEAGVWAAAVFFAADGLDLVFLSSPNSRHAQDLARDPRVAVTIQRDYADWPQITGIQAEGAVEALAGPSGDRARVLYGERFPVVGRAAGAPAAIAEALARVRWYRFKPRRLYLIDNRLGFGHRDELDCGTA
jgi:uncharacterized protein YhbP (UPF0306 family)